MIILNYSESFKIKNLPPLNTISLDNYRLAGFIQAEGCFYISIPKSKTHKTGYRVRLEYFFLTREILKKKIFFLVL